MNKFLRLAFILVIIGIAGAAVIQIFMPKILGSSTQYGQAIYWQREIGFGTNHLLDFMANNRNYGNFVEFVENYLLVIMWLIGLRIEQKNNSSS